MKTKVRLGLYGCNMYRTRDLLEGAKSAAGDQVQVVASFDIDREKADFAAGRYGGKAYYDEASFLADPNVDVVIISLPAFLHADAIVHTMRAGKDIYVEKPICVNPEGRDKIVEAARNSNSRCYVGLSYRYVAPFRKVAEILRRPEAGPIIGVHHHWLTPWVPVPPEEMGWRHSLEKSGGQLIHHCCHVLDWFALIGGPIQSVSATSVILSDVDMPHEEREISATFTYANGGIAVFNLSQDSHQYVQFGSVHTRNLGIHYQWGHDTFVKVFQTRCRVPDEVYAWSGTPAKGDGGEADRNRLQMEDFLGAYLREEPMPITIEDGLRIYDFARAVRESSLSGRRLDVSQAGLPGFTL